ncbi:S-adenosyl-methyltransferase MraW, variant [Aphanomyces astaci]|uniref:S-adenosyl-methyltransferase MraW, variant n=1 Tax=Aphanomyces astaci TaxID=112090 RepID=W4FUI9_APHAT|nr:S-adenosyl-methyltransferase MraW, variant [Aphanomyces astaci]ETV70328.1 S-adenosyl-methyltransferase MraW, variant [Aphanomyces astaci]|eukprot:XP_009840040.1 S-adenosyl-methyltransferase MraW, variant [Aphanomyces astaci]
MRWWTLAGVRVAAPCRLLGIRSRHFHHVPVLPQETLELWAPRRGQTSEPLYYVDGTVGLGGHSRLLLDASPTARLLCIDRDPEILDQAKRSLARFSDRVDFALGSYMDIKTHLSHAGFPDAVDGILVDLGVNSHHLDAGERGFSIYHDGPLDMRFDQSVHTPTAADLVNTLSEVAMIKIFTQYGEEPLAKEFAKAIIRRRGTNPFERTDQLKRCIEAIAEKWKSPKKAAPKTGKKPIHPATRVFQVFTILHIYHSIMYIYIYVLRRHCALPSTLNWITLKKAYQRFSSVWQSMVNWLPLPSIPSKIDGSSDTFETWWTTPRSLN